MISVRGIVGYRDIHRTDVAPPSQAWSIQFVSFFGEQQEQLRSWRFPWDTLGFSYNHRITPPRLVRTSATGPATLPIPGYSYLVILIPYWALLVLLSAPEVGLLLGRLRKRTLLKIQQPEPIDGSTILTDLPCVNCAYNLRMQSTVGRCPECGAPIRNTMSVNKSLAQTRPAWLWWLAIGNAMLVAARLVLIFVFLGIYWSDLRMAGYATLIASLCYAVGVYCLTLREHPFLRPTYHEFAGLRRACAMLAFACVVGGLMHQKWAPRQLTLLGFNWRAFSHNDAITLWLAGWLFFCVSTILEYHFLGRLAGRLLDRFMTEHCRIAGIGAGASGIVIPFWIRGVANPVAWTRGRSSLVFVLLVVIVCWLLFVIWTGFMNLYCAVRFMQQSWLAQEHWRLQQVNLAAVSP